MKASKKWSPAGTAEAVEATIVAAAEAACAEVSATCGAEAAAATDKPVFSPTGIPISEARAQAAQVGPIGEEATADFVEVAARAQVALGS